MKNALKLIIGSAGAAVLFGLAPLAQAQGYGHPDVSWSINVGTHGPVYAPPAVVYAPPPMRPHRVYVAPAPVHYYAPVRYYGRPAWAGHHGHHGWDRHRDHRGHGRDRHDRGHDRGRDGRDGRGHH